MLQLSCQICMQVYNETFNYPILICLNQHLVCKKCFYELFKDKQKTAKCPFCKTKIKRTQAIKFRIFFEFKNLYQEKLQQQLSNVAQKHQILQNYLEHLDNQNRELRNKISQQTKQINKMKFTIQYFKKISIKPISQVQKIEKTVQLTQKLQPKYQSIFSSHKSVSQSQDPKSKKQTQEKLIKRAQKILSLIGNSEDQKNKGSQQADYQSQVDEDCKHLYCLPLYSFKRFFKEKPTIKLILKPDQLTVNTPLYYQFKVK